MAKRAKKRCGSPTGGSQVQSLVFKKTKYSKAKAKAWAKQHGFKYGKVDDTTNTYRLRQFEPGPCEYRTVVFGPSEILGVIETARPKAGRASLNVMRAIERELAERAIS